MHYRGMKAASQPRRNGHMLKMHRVSSAALRCWNGINSRCFNPFADSFAGYGANGITACLYITLDPVNLISIVGERPSGKYSIDRINTFKGYTCGDCIECRKMGWEMNLRWATRSEQGMNKKHSIYLNHSGRKRSVAEIAPDIGLTIGGVYQRIRRGDKNPIRPKRGTVTINGESKTLKEWSRQSGIKIKTLNKRMADGSPPELLLRPLMKQMARKNYRK